MPKIGSITLKFDSECKSHAIFYDRNQLFYVKGLSDEFKGITGFISYGFETEKILVDKLQQAYAKYRELKKNTKKVILYKCYASPELTMNKIASGSYEGLLPGVSRKISNMNIGVSLATFGFDYKIAMLLNDGAVKKYYPILDGCVSANELRDVSGYDLIDYTEQAEEWMESIVDGMKKMVVSASKFFALNPEDAVNYIENKQKLIG